MSYALKRRSEAASAAFDGRKAPRGSMTGLATRPAPVEFESFPVRTENVTRAACAH